MRLPHSLYSSLFFSISSEEHLIQAMSGFIDEAETEEISRLTNLRLPPITSELALATMLGVNPGLIWSFLRNPKRHYNSFCIPGSKKRRIITAPRVALKVCQKWLSFHFQNAHQPADHVFGFVPGRSHIGAAAVHCGAKWTFSIDIKNFFQSTPVHEVRDALQHLGYREKSKKIIADLCCFRGYLSQGSPTSPVLSNIVLRKIDEELLFISKKYKVRLTRYADDIVFSGKEALPVDLRDEVINVFDNTVWQLAKDKISLTESPRRLKVHGLLVENALPKLTKGYRNKLRAYKHILNRGNPAPNDVRRLKGHINYAKSVEHYSLN